MKSLMNVIRGMNTEVEETVDLDESLRSEIAKLSAKFPEGSKVKMKHDGKVATVLSVGKDYIKVGVGSKTMDHKPDELVPVNESALEESTKAYAASLEKIANDKKLKSISKKDRETLAKIAELMKDANESVEYDNQFLEAVKAAASEEDALNEAIEKLVELEEVIAEDYFTVQYYDAKGKAEEGKSKDFKDEKSAKKHLDRANKVVKDGEYKMFKVKGSMDESVELDEGAEKYTVKKGDMTRKVDGATADKMKRQGWKLIATEGLDEAKTDEPLEEHIARRQQDTIKGSSNPYGVSAALIAAVNSVVTGQKESVEMNAQDENEIIEQGAQDLGEALDDVNPKAVKKKFDDRKDKDIDNDGDVDSSDEYLHKKRKAISKSISKEESSDSKDKKDKEGKGEKVEINPKLDEEKMTDAEMKKREEIVLSMKDKIPEFKKKYGDRWEDVMYATATKLAMK